jgi:tetratricopeptide (TPR) repeat protein
MRPVLLGFAAAAAAGFGWGCAAPPPPQQAAPQPTVDLKPLEGKIARIEERLNLLVAAQSQLSKAQPAAGASPAELEALQKRLAAAEEALARVEAHAAASRATPEAKEKPGEAKAAHATLALLVEKLMRNELTAVEKQRMYAAAAAADEVATVTDPLEAAVKKNPNDLQAHMELAIAYLEVAKALTGDVGFRHYALLGDAQIDEVLRIDANNWDALFLRFNSYANWPTYMAKLRASIEGLEALAVRQEIGPPEPKYVGVYTTLANLYFGLADTQKAILTLQRAITLYPKDQDLRRALASYQK